MPVAPELALRQRTKGDDTACVARTDRGVSERDCSTGPVASAPERLRSEREVAHPQRRAQPDGLVSLHELGFGTTESVAPIVVYLCSDRGAQLRSQLITFNGSKLGLWSHPHEAVLDRRPGWTVDELAAALEGATEPVHVVQY